MGAADEWLARQLAVSEMELVEACVEMREGRGTVVEALDGTIIYYECPEPLVRGLLARPERGAEDGPGVGERAIATYEAEDGPISQQALDEADRLLDEAGLAASVAAEPSSPVDDPQSTLRLGPCDQSRTRMGHSGPVAPASRPSAVSSSQSRCSASAT